MPKYQHNTLRFLLVCEPSETLTDEEQKELKDNLQKVIVMHEKMLSFLDGEKELITIRVIPIKDTGDIK